MNTKKFMTAILCLVLIQAACNFRLLPASPPDFSATATALPPSATSTTASSQSSSTVTSAPSTAVPTLAIASPTPLPTATETAALLPTLVQTATPGGLFSAVNLSAQVISPSCEPKSVRFEVSPATEAILGVILFYRLHYRISDERTIWNLGVPMNISNGKFTYVLQASSLRDFNQFKEPVAWVQYQLVATDISGRVIGRSQVFTNNLTISAICP